MRRPERVVFALSPLGEPRQAAAPAQGSDAVAAPGEDLVRIGLVADVPDQPVARRVEDVMDGGGELDDAEPGAKMAARNIKIRGIYEGYDTYSRVSMGRIEELEILPYPTL